MSSLTSLNSKQPSLRPAPVTIPHSNIPLTSESFIAQPEQVYVGDAPRVTSEFRAPSPAPSFPAPSQPGLDNAAAERGGRVGSNRGHSRNVAIAVYLSGVVMLPTGAITLGVGFGSGNAIPGIIGCVLLSAGGISLLAGRCLGVGH